MQIPPKLTSPLRAIAYAGLLGGVTLLIPIWTLVADDPQPSSQPDVATDAKAEMSEADAARQLLSEAQYRLLEERTSVRARLRETVCVGERRFETTGSYTAGPLLKSRMEFSVQVGKTAGTLVEICDGQILWSIREIKSPGNAEPRLQVSRTVIADVLEALDESFDAPESLLIARMGVGGLPALLASLERSMDFDALKTAEHEGQKYTVIQGRWNQDYLTRLGGKAGATLPSHLPDVVRIYFDQTSLFPTRILYLKHASTDSKLPYQLLMSLEFSDIVLDGPLDEDQFRYVPPDGIQVENRTTAILEMMDAARDRAAKAAAAP